MLSPICFSCNASICSLLHTLLLFKTSIVNMELDKENQPPNVSLYRAEEIFKESLSGSTVKLSDPTRIQDQLSSLKDVSSKLKFQYLEQETRDKFLRHILLDHEQKVTETDVTALASHNLVAKADLKEIKQELQLLLRENESTCNDVINLNKKCEQKQHEIDSAITDVGRLQEELDLLLNDPSNENFKTLFNMHKLIDTEDLGLDEAIVIAENAVTLESIAVAEVESQVVKAEEKVRENLKLEKDLQLKLENLHSQLKSAQALQDKTLQSPEQIHAQNIREIDTILRRLVDSNYDLEAKEDKILLKIKDITIQFDSELYIILSLGGVSDKAIDLINGAGKDKFWHLLRLLSEIICKN